MASQWYYYRDGRERGPITSQQLRQLAASGKLQRSDKIRKEGMSGTVPAMNVKNLFPPSAREWYYYQGGQEWGPVTSRQLRDLARSGKLQPEDMVRKEGMSSQVPASSVKNLFPDPPATKGIAPAEDDQGEEATSPAEGSDEDEMIVAEVVPVDEENGESPQPAAPKYDAEVLGAAITDLLKRHLPQDGLFVAPSVPSKKMDDAQRVCQIPSGERILGLVEGSANNALVFASRGVYYHGHWLGKSAKAGNIVYADFPVHTFGEGNSNRVLLGRGKSLSLMGCLVPLEKLIGILGAIQDIVADLQTSSEQEAVLAEAEPAKSIAQPQKFVFPTGRKLRWPPNCVGCFANYAQEHLSIVIGDLTTKKSSKAQVAGYWVGAAIGMGGGVLGAAIGGAVAQALAKGMMDEGLEYKYSVPICPVCKQGMSKREIGLLEAGRRQRCAPTSVLTAWIGEACVILTFSNATYAHTFHRANEGRVYGSVTDCLASRNSLKCDSDEGSLEAIILEILRRRLPQDGLFVAPKIDPKRMNNAAEKCGVPADERMLGLIDCTLTGSGKNALVFGGRAIYFHNGFGAKTPGAGVVSYDEFPGREFTILGYGRPEVSLGNDQFLNISASTVPKDGIVDILQKIQQAVITQSTTLTVSCD